MWIVGCQKITKNVVAEHIRQKNEISGQSIKMMVWCNSTPFERLVREET